MFVQMYDKHKCTWSAWKIKMKVTFEFNSMFVMVMECKLHLCCYAIITQNILIQN